VRWLHDDVQKEVDLLYVNHGDFPRRQEISSIEEWPQSSDHEPIDCFHHSLNIYTEQKSPVFWATLQRNLGLAYCHRIQGDHRGNLERSIECFTRSLRIYNKDEFPIQWGIINDDVKKAFVLLNQTVNSSSEVLTLSLKSQ
jgi:hypothetical protein